LFSIANLTPLLANPSPTSLTLPLRTRLRSCARRCRSSCSACASFCSAIVRHCAHVNTATSVTHEGTLIANGRELSLINTARLRDRCFNERTRIIGRRSSRTKCDILTRSRLGGAGRILPRLFVKLHQKGQECVRQGLRQVVLRPQGVADLRTNCSVVEAISVMHRSSTSRRLRNRTANSAQREIEAV
jgi:transposase